MKNSCRLFRSLFRLIKAIASNRLVYLTALLLIILVMQEPAWAIDPTTLPTGGQVSSGQGTISQTGNTLTVAQQSNKLIANWNTFNIGRNASVIFQQPSSSSVALNRILDQNPSQIYGNLTANGQVFLVNTAGIYFGPTAQVDVGALVASSLNITNDNFLAGKYLFENSGSAGAIINDGTIKTANGGYVAFLSPQITNNGNITSAGGIVAMAAGDKVELDFTGDHLINFTINQGTIDALIANNGIIQADGGVVLITAKAADSLTRSVVNNTGFIEASGIGKDGGRIVLYADGGQTTISGTLNVSSDTASGGTVITTGDRVLVESGAHLTASGAAGGGEVLVGGSWQGNDSSIYSATGTIIESGAFLEANATVNGNGGTVVAWSDVNNENSVTRVYGTLEAMGGSEGGNGGRIETSGHWLDIAGVTGSASATSGISGTWLMDPYNVTITTATANGSFSSGTWTPGGSWSTIANTDINTLLNSDTNVTITTGSTGSENGDITVSSAITKSAGSSETTLTLQAAKTIEVDADISNTSAVKMNVVLNADSDKDGAGIIMLNADITTGGGYLNFGIGNTATINGVSTLVGGDVYVAGSGARTISTGGGAVNVNGEMIVANTSGLTINSGGGDVHFHGLLNSGNSYESVNVPAGITWAAALDAADSNDTDGDGSDVGDSYLATITSRLENAVASRTVNYNESWLGARRDSGLATWRWVTGPEGRVTNSDGTTGLKFFTQSSSGGGTAINGAYTNWNSGEPNNWTGSATGADLTKNYEFVLQFTGSTGVWNDLAGSGGLSTAAKLNYYVKETNLASSPVTINAGAGTVTFDGAVGSSKALSSLTVTAATTNINGGAVTTDGSAGQSYSGNIVLGSASIVLTQTGTENAFTLVSGKSITNGFGSDASFTIKNTGSIIMDTSSSITSSSGKLNTTLSADTDSDGGYVLLNSGSSISSNGGNVTLSGGSGYSGSYGIYTSSDATVSTGSSGNLTATSAGGAILFGGALTIGGTTAMTASGYDVTAVNAGNDFGSTVTLTGKEIDILDQDDLTLGAVTSTGTVDIVTTTGDMTLTGAVSTTDTSSNAIILNSAKSIAAGTATGGSIVVSGGSVSTGTGGRAILYTGSVSNSTGLSPLIGSGSGNFRYNSDETTTNYSTGIGSSGTYAVYREQPTVTITADNDSKTYNATSYTAGSNGVSYSGFVNGDTSSVLSGTKTYGGTSQGAVNVGSYTITLTHNLSNGLGYSIAYGDGALTINKADLTITANNDNKIYDGVAYSGGNGVTYAGFIGGESTTDLGGALSYGGTGQGAKNSGTYSITPQGFTSSNYLIRFLSGTLTIVRVPQLETTGTTLTNPQNTLDSPSQQESSTITSVNPGVGSTALTNFASTTIVTQTASVNTILTTSQFSIPVSFNSADSTTTLNVGNTSASAAPLMKACTLPIFSRTGGDEPSLQANVIVKQNDSAISLTQTSAAGAVVPPEIIPANISATFSLSTDSGATVEFTVSVGKNGVLLVTSTESAGNISAEQAVLMGMLTARQELKVDLSTLKAALLVQP